MELVRFRSSVVAGMAVLSLPLVVAVPAVSATWQALQSQPVGGGVATEGVAAARSISKKKLKAPKPKIVGKAVVGKRLTVKTGTWGPGKVMLKIRWLRDGKSIKKATSKAYRLKKVDVGKKISVEVTGEKKGYAKKTRKAKAVKVQAAAKTPSNWTTVTAEYTSTCGVRGGALWCWGISHATKGPLGGTPISTTPIRVGAAADWTTVTAGAEHTCGIRNGTLWCWGDNYYGQLVECRG